MSQWWKIMSVKYCLPIPVFHFWPKLTLSAARPLCDSWASCYIWGTAHTHTWNELQCPSPLLKRSHFRDFRASASRASLGTFGSSSSPMLASPFAKLSVRHCGCLCQSVKVRVGQLTISAVASTACRESCLIILTVFQSTAVQRYMYPVLAC